MPLTFEGVRAAGATLGSGVVLVLDDTVSVPAAAAPDHPVLPRRVLRPVRAVPGRHRPPGGTGGAAGGCGKRPLGSVATELALLSDIGFVTRDASICGLGQTALSAVQSAVKLGLIGRLGPLTMHRTFPTTREQGCLR